MYDKISEIPIREEKVKRLKTKILAEIDEKLRYFKNHIEIHMSDDRVFNRFIKESFALLNLKEYIEDNGSFMLATAVYPDEDIIVYRVSDKNLEIWLQEDYSFVSNFLFQVKENNCDVFSFLNEDYFAYDFTNILDGVWYEEKVKQQKVER